MKAATKEWIQYADQDLKAAEFILADESLASVSAFHSQQTVEKCLKALLEEKEMNIPKTHDLEKLAARVQEGWGISFEDKQLLVLNTVYIESRYPGGLGLLPSGKPSPAECEVMLRFAKQLKNQVLSLLD